MIEFTLLIFERGGTIGGLGSIGAPSSKEKSEAASYFVFRRGDTRIHALGVSRNVTMEGARELAQKLYEGKSKRINFNDAARIDRFAAVWRGNVFT